MQALIAFNILIGKSPSCHAKFGALEERGKVPRFFPGICIEIYPIKEGDYYKGFTRQGRKKWVAIVCFQKKSIPPSRKGLEIPEGVGGQYGDKFSYKLCKKVWKFQRGWGVKSQHPSVVGVWIFSGITQCPFEALPHNI